MVARPEVAVTVDRMTVDDLAAVHIIEHESFSTPWPSHAYRQELETNRLAHYVVARVGDDIVGFAGMWLLVDEAHITTFATRTTWRRQGVGERLLLALLELSADRGAAEATLEVRPTNIAARKLYEKYGFKVVGVRPRYYSDNNEDALIMTTDSLDGRPMLERIVRLRADLARRPPIRLGPDGLPMDSRSDAAGFVAARSNGPADVAAAGSGAGRGDSQGALPEPRTLRPAEVTRRRL